MRRFTVWLNRNVVGVEDSEEIVEMPDDASDHDCDEACKEVLESMIENSLDTGWVEIDPRSRGAAEAKAPSPASKGRRR